MAFTAKAGMDGKQMRSMFKGGSPKAKSKAKPQYMDLARDKKENSDLKTTQKKPSKPLKVAKKKTK